MKNVTPQTIIEIVCEAYGILPENITLKTNAHEISHPRFVCCDLMAEYLDLTLHRIAFVLDIDHSTVHYGIKKVHEWQQFDKKFNELYQIIRQRIEANYQLNFNKLRFIVESPTGKRAKVYAEDDRRIIMYDDGSKELCADDAEAQQIIVEHFNTQSLCLQS